MDDLVSLVGQKWRAGYEMYPPARLFPCALAGRGRYCTERPGIDNLHARRNWMVWDHCHEHGYIRGALCSHHNRVVGLFERGARYANQADILTPYLRGCAGCVEA